MNPTRDYSLFWTQRFVIFVSQESITIITDPIEYQRDTRESNYTETYEQQSALALSTPHYSALPRFTTSSTTLLWTDELTLVPNY